MVQTANLYRLQQIDNQIDRVTSRLQVIQEVLGDEQELVQAAARVESTQMELQKGEQEVRQAEMNANAQRTKIEQTEANLYSGTVHNPKELQDLQNDVASLKKHLSNLEDQLLEKMLALDEKKAENQRALEDQKRIQENHSTEHVNLLEEQTSLKKDVERLGAEKRAITSAISGEHLALYTGLRKEKKGIAVAGVSDNACEICGAQLTPAQAQAVSSLQRITHCATCGRILFSLEAR